MEWSNEIIKVLDDLGQRFGIAIDWTQQNISPYVQQLLNKIVIYKLSIGSVGVGVSLLFMLFATVYLLKTNKTKKIFEWIGGRGIWGWLFSEWKLFESRNCDCINGNVCFRNDSNFFCKSCYYDKMPYIS